MTRLRSTAAFNSIVADLREAWGHGFQRVVHTLVAQVWTDLRYAPDLVSRLDRSGIDLYEGDEPHFRLVIQCKGYQAPFDDTHLKDALRSIKKFKESLFTCQAYWIVLNRPIHDPAARTALDTALKELVESGSASEADWMDAPDLVEKVVQKSISDLKEALPKHNREYLEHYEQQMRHGRAYMPSVPFRKFIRHTTRNHGQKNPARAWYMDSDARNPLGELTIELSSMYAVKKANPKPTHVRAYRIVLSGFGFGKTSLMLELATTLSSSTRLAIYIPVAELSAGAFESEHTFVSEVYDIIYSTDRGATEGATSVPLQAFRRALRTDPVFVLLLDGLDEHRLSYSPEGISQIFSCIRNLFSDVLISARTEFWEANRGSIEHALKGTGDNRQFHQLMDWDADAMLAYLEEFAPSPGLDAVRNIIVDDKYEEIYGDIPKRPLFLEMLVEDVAASSTIPTTLLELYGRCLTRKLERDISSPFVNAGNIIRPLPAVGLDLDEIRRRVFLLLTELAGMTYDIDYVSGRVLLRETVTEIDLKVAAEAAGLGAAVSLPLILHSLLASTNRRSTTGEMLLRFAHRSYQEYFLAHFLVRKNIDTRAELPHLVLQFIAGLMGDHGVIALAEAAPESFLL